MTFAELICLLAVGMTFYYLLIPLRRRLESRLSKFFRAKMRHKERPIIDITDYQKKKEPKDEI